MTPSRVTQQSNFVINLYIYPEERGLMVDECYFDVKFNLWRL